MMISKLACPRLFRTLMLLMVVSFGPAHAQATASPDGLIKAVTQDTWTLSERIAACKRVISIASTPWLISGSCRLWIFRR
jgi:hypothetical protein